MKQQKLLAASPLFVGMDVHKRTIAFCAFNRDTGVIVDERQLVHDVPRVRKYLAKLQREHGELACCYEASSCGYGLQRVLAAHGIPCEVIAPTSIPRRAGDRVKTDRRDAQNLACLYAGGLLTPVTVPDEDQEAVRSLLRCRADFVQTAAQTKHRILSFVQTRGFRYSGATNWTKAFRAWVNALSLTGADQLTLQAYLHNLEYQEMGIRNLEDQLAEAARQEPLRPAVQVLMAFRGIGLITALTVVCELGDIRRFSHPRQLMAYLGLVPSEYSSGNRTRRGAITKTGNTQVRTALVSAAWKYTAPPRCSKVLLERQQRVSAEVVTLSWKAQTRLYQKFAKLSRTKLRPVAAVAVARELAGFLWAALQKTPRTASA